MEEKLSKHLITIEKREKVCMSGVLDVLSFDEENIVAQTDSGIIILRGYNLHINNLNLDKGDLNIDGTILSLTYDDLPNSKESFLNRLFK